MNLISDIGFCVIVYVESKKGGEGKEEEKEKEKKKTR
ncbi:MAG: hypothetical protein ACI8RD_009274 [Bacillariaceae sp.]|jgi:hypothetical protein